MADRSSPEQLKEKLMRALKAKAVLTEKSKLLEQQSDDARRREEMHGHFISELLDRQRESNFMLHRANSVLHRLQETNVALSSEFTEFVKELPAPNSPDWEQRVAKINELFRKTGELADEVQDEVFKKGAPAEDPQTPLVAPQAVAQPAEEFQSRPEPSAPDTTPEPVAETQREVPMAVPVFAEAEPETVEAEFTATETAKVDDIDREKRLERLFRKLDAVETEKPSPVELVDLDAPIDRKPGIFSRVWGKATRRDKRHDHESEIDKAS